MSCSMALRRSPKPGALTATERNVPRILLTTRVERASPSMSSAMITSGLAALHDLLEHGHEVAHGGDLRGHEQHVGVVEDGLHALGVGHEVGRDVALVEAHALDEVGLDAEGVRLLDGDDAVAGRPCPSPRRWRSPISASLLAEMEATLAICSLSSTRRTGRGCDSTAASTAASMPRLRSIGLAPAATFLRPSRHHGPGEHGGGGGAVAGDVVGLLGDLLDQLGADLLVGVFELDVLGDADAVLGDRGGTPLLLEDDVAALRAEGDGDGVGELVHAGFEGTAGLLVEGDDLGHPGSPWERVDSVSTLRWRVLTANHLAAR